MTPKRRRRVSRGSLLERRCDAHLLNLSEFHDNGSTLCVSQLLPSFEPWAQCYGGHQFGSWAGQLGDGRAVSLCQARGADPALLWELQLKGRVAAHMFPFTSLSFPILPLFFPLFPSQGRFHPVLPPRGRPRRAAVVRPRVRRVRGVCRARHPDDARPLPRRHRRRRPARHVL